MWNHAELAWVQRPPVGKELEREREAGSEFCGRRPRGGGCTNEPDGGDQHGDSERDGRCCCYRRSRDRRSR